MRASAARWIRARADLLIIIVIVLGVGGANWWHTLAEGREFCAVIEAATASPVPRPADPAANPSRESNYEFYIKFVQLGMRLGCG